MILIIPLVLLILGLAATLSLFVSLKREIRLLGRRHGRRIDHMLERLDQAASEPTVLPAGPRSGMNLTWRTHALRLIRQGEGAEHIAAALGIPMREVELLIRVHRVTNP